MGKIVSFPSGAPMKSDRPCCYVCRKPIQEHEVYVMAGVLICEHCIDIFKMPVEDIPR